MVANHLYNLLASDKQGKYAKQTTTCYGINNVVQTLHRSFTNNKQSHPTDETNKRRKQPQTSRQTAAVLQDSFLS
jgi:hypothetical protein